MVFNSIRWRLQVWYGLLLLVFLAGFEVTAYKLQRGRVFQQLDAELHRRLNQVDVALRNQRGRDRGPDPLRQPGDLPQRLQDRPPRDRPFPEGPPGDEFPEGEPGRTFAGPPPDFR